MISPVGVSAAPVATGGTAGSIESDAALLSAVGSQLLAVDGGVLGVSNADLGRRSVAFVAGGGVGEDNSVVEVTAERVVSGPIAAQGNRVAVIDLGGETAVEAGSVDDPRDRVLRLLELPAAVETEFSEVATAVVPEEQGSEISRFGTHVAIGGNAIAIVSETTSRSDRIDIFTVTPAGTVDWAQQLDAGTLETSVAISASGAIIASSGVNRLAGSGDLLVHRIGPSGWVPIQRFLRIGGGPVVLDQDRIFVQRSNFFVRGPGPWAVLGSAPGSPFELIAELPVEGDVLAVDGRRVAVGDAARDVVYLLEERAGRDDYAFSQAIEVPSGNPGGEVPLFGSAVAFVPGGGVGGPESMGLYVGAPGPAAGQPAGQIHRFDVVEGPIGCTMVGTAGNDELISRGGPIGETLCGLAGSDALVSVSARDRLDGGPGSDSCTGPAAEISNCE